MKHRFLSLTLVLCLLAGLLPVPAAAAGTHGPFNVTVDRGQAEWVEGESILRLYYGGQYEVSMADPTAPAEARIEVTNDIGTQDTRLTLNGVWLEHGESPLEFMTYTAGADRDMALELLGDNKLICTGQGAGVQKDYDPRATVGQGAGVGELRIFGTGTLTAQGRAGGAGIGGDLLYGTANITISGGTVHASAVYDGGAGGAGIGTGSTGSGIAEKSDAVNIRITGGTVIATGASSPESHGTGAGIGGAGLGVGASVIIEGGTVTAIGGTSTVSSSNNNEMHAAPGIGGVLGGTTAVTVTGGTIRAIGGSYQLFTNGAWNTPAVPGIGHSDHNTPSTVTVTGGSIDSDIVDPRNGAGEALSRIIATLKDLDGSPLADAALMGLPAESDYGSYQTRSDEGGRLHLWLPTWTSLEQINTTAGLCYGAASAPGSGDFYLSNFHAIQTEVQGLPAARLAVYTGDPWNEANWKTAGQPDKTYTALLDANGANGYYNTEQQLVSFDRLPAGYSLEVWWQPVNADGTLGEKHTIENPGTIEWGPTGTPTLYGGPTYSFTMPEGPVKVTAAVKNSEGKIAPTVTTRTLPGGTQGQAYSQSLTATGDPATWSVTDGALPAGLSLNADTGLLSGTPTTAGSSTFTVTAANAAGSHSMDLSLTVQHVHGRWAFAATAQDTITASCGAAGCSDPVYSRAITLEPPADPVFDGSPKEAEVSVPIFDGVDLQAMVRYAMKTGDDWEEVDLPEEPGTYRASLTLEDRTAAVEYTVSAAYSAPAIPMEPIAVAVAPASSGGSMKFSPISASAGAKITIYETAPAGQVLAAVRVTDQAGARVASPFENGRFRFALPAGGAKVDPGYLRQGDLDRGELVELLWWLAGSPAYAGGAVFADADSAAVSWAASSGLVLGHGDGTFRPGEGLTCQQLALILYRWAGLQGLERTPIGTAPDGSAPWAAEALSWAIGSGLLEPEPDPASAATGITAAHLLRALQ